MDSSTSKMQYKHFCYIDESWLTSYEALYGFRGVFTLKSSVKISSGKGTSDEPYVLN
jgi:hypothetical protein